jgi:ABC-type multidrug transport system fused ATPase/permease subunit
MSEQQPADQSSEGKTNPGKYSPFQALILILTLLGLFSILSGLISLLGSFFGFIKNVQVAGALFNALFGVLVFLSTRVLAKRSMIGTWIFIASILLSLGTNYVLSGSFNILMALFGAVVAWQLFRLKQEGEIR